MVGQAPEQGGGLRLQDSDWLRGVASGENMRASAPLTATAGGAQAAQDIPVDALVVDLSTVASANDSYELPFASQGKVFFLSNRGANTCRIYAKDGVNPATGVEDTINAGANADPVTIATMVVAVAVCPVNGRWIIT